MVITGYDNLIVNGMTFNNGLVDNVLNINTIGTIYNYCTFDTSTNQTLQTGGSYCTVEFNNCNFRNGADDGISSHDENTIITANNCTFEGNVQGINSISSGIVYANDCNFIGNTQDLKNDADSQIIATRCTLRNQVVANSSKNLQLINCNILSGQTFISITGSILVSDCKYMGLSYITSYQTDITKVQIQRCFFEMTTQTKINLGNGTARFNADYSVFKHTGSTNTYAVTTGGVNTCTINNCTFVGNSNVGRGIAAQGPTVVKNTIFTKLNLCVNPNGVNSVVLFDYCNTFDNTTINVNQGGGTFTNTNNITTNPLLTNITTNDFRLQVGSGAIGTGTTLTNEVGIETADWNTDIPSITTKNQSATWNRGAYV